MKTTIELPDELFREAKELAAQEKVPMRVLVIEGLRSEIERRAADRPKADLHRSDGP